ncbi:MAG: GNAT family N-acetyltransferase [Xanthomonadales bacterium]|nr:GNAT family N-acetyltransferase [Xanthomonadales bacterium]
MIRTLTEVDECRSVWQALSPGKKAWDDWDLMYAFHDQEAYSFNFLVKLSGNSPSGLVPLVKDLSDGSFELFGGCYPDSRQLWVAHDDFPEYFEHLPENTVFFDMNGPWVEALLSLHPQYSGNFAERDNRYYLVPDEFDYDFNNHIAKFSSEKRKGFLYDLRKIREKGPELHWSTDDESQLFIDLCNRRFGDDSDYVKEGGKAELRRVISELRESGCLRTLTISMDGAKHAVSMSALYSGTMIALYAASNYDYKNLGKLLNVETIQEACRIRANEINYMTGMSWKEAWDMKSEAVYTMRKPAKVLTDNVSGAAS